MTFRLHEYRPDAAARGYGAETAARLRLDPARVYKTLVDTSAEAFGTVFVSGSRRGLELEISPQDLVALTGATVAAVARR